ncbi:TatD family hydrolase [Candidatus Woesearchaeota archaeon]|nr:TatD family hydrolase [Candidatus Woesearchaeota archaeon]
MLVDVHSHLDDRQFDKDISEVIERAKKENVVAIINNGLNSSSNRRTLELSKRFPIVKPALGIYPTDGLKLSDEEIDAEIAFIRKQKIIAVGEVGLDYHWDASQKERQKEIFRKMIALASDLDKPIIVHSRKAEEDAFEIIKETKIKKAVFHCYNGPFKIVDEMVRKGYYFSIPTNIVFSSHFQELVGRIPLSHILTETDAPYLGPRKGERNEPANIACSIKKIAEIKKMTEPDVMNNIFMNYQRVF